MQHPHTWIVLCVVRHQIGIEWLAQPPDDALPQPVMGAAYFVRMMLGQCEFIVVGVFVPQYAPNAAHVPTFVQLVHQPIVEWAYNKLAKGSFEFFVIHQGRSPAPDLTVRYEEYQ